MLVRSNRNFPLRKISSLSAIFLSLLLFLCDEGGPGVPSESKIMDTAIKGTWIKISGNTAVDTAIFTEEKLEAPGVSAVTESYKVENGKITLADEVMAEYEIFSDTLFIEPLASQEPDGTVNREIAIKYMRSINKPGDTIPVVNKGDMDSIGKNIPIGLPMNYTDTLYTANMVLISAAWDTFAMGIANSQYEKDYQHQTCLTYNYYIGKMEVTCGEYCNLMNYAIKEGYAEIVTRELYSENVQVIVNKQGEEQILLNIGDEKKRIGYSTTTKGLVPLFNSRYPAVFVSWYGAAFYCDMLSEQRGLEKVYDINDWSINYGANGYRLPTNAEHEYATRGGSKADYFWGTNWSNNLKYVVDAGASNGVYPVGSKTNNRYGLFDMVGNAYEVCNDLYASTYYSESPFFNPVGPKLDYLTLENTSDKNSVSVNRVIRGGGGESTALSGWHQDVYPGHTNDRNGFRIVLPVKEKR